jgi:hypothetical protein
MLKAEPSCTMSNADIALLNRAKLRRLMAEPMFRNFKIEQALLILMLPVTDIPLERREKDLKLKPDPRVT